MDFKDFKLVRSMTQKAQNATKQVAKLFRERNSRPRAKENIINPDQKGI